MTLNVAEKSNYKRRTIWLKFEAFLVWRIEILAGV